jgi:CheY-like chemotaxis protein
MPHGWTHDEATGRGICSQSLRKRSRSVLVVEDDEVSRMVAMSFLETMGHKVTLASDGRQAIEAVERHDFDAVLMDISLPRMSGIEAAQHIRTLPELRKRQVSIRAPCSPMAAQSNTSVWRPAGPKGGDGANLSAKLVEHNKALGSDALTTAETYALALARAIARRSLAKRSRQARSPAWPSRSTS